ncbi:ABC transporter substrate-binding protein [Saccharomonospora sp. NPDC006951]
MKRTRTAAVRSFFGATMAAALAVTASCSAAAPDSGTGAGKPSEISYQEGIVGGGEDGDPVKGGTLSLAPFAEPRSLDPAVTIASGSTGGIEMINIYDTLMRYDSAEKDFVPQLAEKLEAGEDNTTWTLTLREGVTFSDGSPLDAEAVKFSQERYAGMPAPEAALWNDNVTGIETSGPRTVVYRLDSPWPSFPSVLSTGPGMIVAEGAGEGESFTPVGAGPFALERWAPQEEMVLAARKDYWAGAPHLDKVRFAYLTDQQAGIDSLNSGGVDAVFVRDPDKVDTVLGEDKPAYVNMVALSNIALINASEGRPGEDPRVRKAMQLATNPQLMMERAFNGAGYGSSAMFPEYSRWHTETGGLPHDTAEAKRLLEEAKADGFDGKVEFLDASDPASRSTALAFKAQLEAVGFEVTTNLARTVADQISKISVEKDYDVVAWGLSYRESDPFSKMYATMHSNGTQVYSGYTSGKLDELIERFQAAASEKDQLAVMDEIQRQVNEDVPYLSWGPFAEIVTWNDNVHGVTGAANSMVLLGSSWKG